MAFSQTENTKFNKVKIMIHTELYRPKEAATILKQSPSTLARWRHEGIGPKYSKLNTGSILYEEADLIEFIRQFKK